MNNVIERVYGVGVTVDDIDEMKPGHAIVSGIRSPPEVDGVKTSVADDMRFTRNCAIHRVEAIGYPLPDTAPDLGVGDIVRVRHEHLEQIDMNDMGLCSINAAHILVVLKDAEPST